MILFNEQAYTTQMIEENNKDMANQLTTGQLAYQIVLYVHSQITQSYDATELADKAYNIFCKLQPDNYNYVYIKKTIANAIKTVMDGATFKNVDKVILYKSEVDYINSLKTRAEKKLLATLFVLARWNDNDGWTNARFTLADIKKCADLNSYTHSQLNKILFKFVSDGIVSLSKNPKYLRYQVNLCQDSDAVCEFTSFEHIGNKFITSIDSNYDMCKCCGNLIKKSTRRPRMYCKWCVKKIKNRS